MIPKVSIIMGIYNCEETISDSIESILKQTYKNWELIMCDDASTDNTYNIAKKYSERNPDRIILIKNTYNKRLAATLNHCLEYVSGDYIARMDGDDLSTPTRFEEQVKFLTTHSEFELVGTQMISFDESGDIGIQGRIEIPNKFSLRFGTPFCHATIMCRKLVYENLKGYRISKEIRRCEDVDLWFRFFAAGFSGYNLQRPLYKVRENQTAFKRRSFADGLDSAKVSLYGYRLLNYPARYYIYLLKPLISGAMPAWVMKKYHQRKDIQTNNRKGG
nr:glycosyltransferase [uncultured Trichococcus sp.]